MRKYQEPEMEIIQLGSVTVITDSTLYVPGDGSNTGGGTSEGTGWGSF